MFLFTAQESHPLSSSPTSWIDFANSIDLYLNQNNRS